MRMQKRMAAAKWSANAVLQIIRGEHVDLPKRAPSWAAELLETAELALAHHIAHADRREIERLLGPVITKRTFARAIEQAARNFRDPPNGAAQPAVELQVAGKSHFLNNTSITNMLADAFFEIANIRRRDISQTIRQRQRDDRARRAEVRPLASSTLPAPPLAPGAVRAVFGSDASAHADIEGPMALALRVTRRLSH